MLTTARHLVFTVVLLLLWSCAASRSIDERTLPLPVMRGAEPAVPVAPARSLKLVSLNLAHGRKDSLNQLLVSDKKTRQNLDDIAAFLESAGADVVALQEADSPSPWSGEFDHVAYLAEAAGYPYYVYTEHARLWMGNYGTAILSKWPIQSAFGLTFPSTPPTASKGFTLAQVAWSADDAGIEPVLVDVVSVHLDFSRKSVRRQQLDELVAALQSRQGPLVIMGDFNSEWLARKYLVESFADSSPMHVYDAASEDLNTYKDQRLDWIVLSRDLEFDNYHIAPELLSDHRAVVTDMYLCTQLCSQEGGTR